MTTATTVVEPTPAAQAAPAAPAATPAAPAAPAVPPAAPAAPAAPETPPAAPETWEATGDSVVDAAAAAFLKGGGTRAALDSILTEVAETGKISPTAKSVIEKALGDNAPLALASLEAKASAHHEWVKAERAAVYKEFGTEAQFTAAQEWAKTNLSQSERDFINRGLNQGGDAAKLASQQLLSIMKSRGANVEGQVERPNNTTTQGNEQLIGLQDYINQERVLRAKGDTQGLKALEARGRAAQKAAAAQGLRWR